MNTDALKKAWETHYQRNRSRLSYPDENLVRLLKGIAPGPALDLGCGSGRHLSLLRDFGHAPIFGMDLSIESVELCQDLHPEAEIRPVNVDEMSRGGFSIPFDTGSLEIIVAWGVLHYNSPDMQRTMLEEVRRTLSSEGHFLGTLRAVGDTHFRRSEDINGIEIRYFTENDVRDLLEEYFDQVEIGFMERRPLNRTEDRVCHWYFRTS